MLLKRPESKLFDLFSNESVHFQRILFPTTIKPMTFLTLPLKFVNGPSFFASDQIKFQNFKKGVLVFNFAFELLLELNKYGTTVRRQHRGVYGTRPEFINCLFDPMTRFGKIDKLST